MKLSPAYFSIAAGIALSFSFLICNLILLIGGKDFSLSLTNIIFHNLNISTETIIGGFDIVKLFLGMILLFLDGALIGYIWASIYNYFITNKPPFQ